MGKLFGTDGIRGVANKELTCDLAFRAGQAIAIVLTGELRHKAKIYIGKDTRISSDMIECALAAGISSVGAEVGLLGYVPTPAVAYLTVKHGADAGIVISASHNPMEFNGIKAFNSQGFKLSDELEERVEEIILSGKPVEVMTGADIGKILKLDSAAKEYTEYVKNTVIGDLSGMKILIDCANGASYRTARMIFEGLGADFEIMFDAPNGTNINDGCGSTHMDKLRARVAAGEYNVGIAFDGDADRCLVVDENGDVVDGDKIMALCAKILAARGKLPHNTFVATVLSNLGLHAYARENGLVVECSNVGDRNVLELMEEKGYVLGGEQSGHIIFREFATTGDGELTAVQFLSMLKEMDCNASEAAAEISQYPQIMINVKVENHIKDEVLSDPGVKKIVRETEKELGNDGRILVRPSGTEPLVRVMVEGKDSKEVSWLAGCVADKISEVAKEKKGSKK